MTSPRPNPTGSADRNACIPDSSFGRRVSIEPGSIPASLGGFDPRRTPVLGTDVLVIGGGVAGCSAALAAADSGCSVLMLTKSAFTDTNTAWAQGGMAAPLGADDSVESHLADTLNVGQGLTNAAVAREIVSSGNEAVRWLQEVGANFDRQASGELSRSREGGHSVSRVVHSRDATGAEVARALSQAIGDHPHITCRSPAFVRDLLVEDGACVGAIAILDGTELALLAGSVVLATGGAGQIYRETTNPIGAGGDGVAMAFRAGAAVADMEFLQFHPTTLYIAGAARFLISEVVRGAGAKLRDRDGVRFMTAAHASAELAPRDVVSRAILQRMVEIGDTHVYLDLSDVDGDPTQRFPSIARICRGFDIDIAKDPIPVRPGAHYMIGGVVATASGQTRIPHLYAIGECSATGFHGANRLASNSLLEGAVSGRLAGVAAAREAGVARRHALPAPRPEPEVGVDRPRVHYDDMLYSLKSLMWRRVGLLREADGLNEATERLAMWHHYLTRARPRDRRGYELANMLTTSLLVTTAATIRCESRGVHYRVDHAQRNDAEWCRHLHLERTADGGIDVAANDVTAPSDSSAA